MRKAVLICLIDVALAIPCSSPVFAQSECPPACIGMDGVPDSCSTQAVFTYSATIPCPHGGGTFGSGTANRPAGAVSAGAGTCFDSSTYALVKAQDRFRIVGAATSTPIDLTAVLVCFGTGVASLREGTRSVVELSFGSRTVALALQHSVNEDFALEYGVTGTSLQQMGGGSMAGSLSFQGLPPGYAIESCHGYRQTVSVQPTTWSQVRTLYR